MEKMISYVFGSLTNNEKAIDEISKTIKKLEKSNTRVWLGLCGLSAYMMMTTQIIKEQDKKIKLLSKEVVGLKERKEV